MGQRRINIYHKEKMIKVYNKKVSYWSGKKTVKGKAVLKKVLTKVVH